MRTVISIAVALLFFAAPATAGEWYLKVLSAWVVGADGVQKPKVCEEYADSYKMCSEMSGQPAANIPPAPNMTAVQIVTIDQATATDIDNDNDYVVTEALDLDLVVMP